ncbi:hypothetical protein F2Q68_00001730 [Brassica cretica]|uniref:FCP1 homology domain-containing protein n=1 Tax=Brassica cretica TaxID=69181 RepID=A0A8S9J8J2_BRACR|nr:hypothetical protein F2Q68_00001730 [Brassica cretica]
MVRVRVHFINQGMQPNISCVTVFECLGLHEFLEQLSQFAHLIVFTADLEGSL